MQQHMQHMGIPGARGYPPCNLAPFTNLRCARRAEAQPPPSHPMLRARSARSHQPYKKVPFFCEETILLLNLFTVSDCAWQCLARFTLEPVHEATFHPRNFGFRDSFSIHDIQRVLFFNLKSSFYGIQKRILPSHPPKRGREGTHGGGICAQRYASVVCKACKIVEQSRPLLRMPRHASADETDTDTAECTDTDKTGGLFLLGITDA